LEARNFSASSGVQAGRRNDENGPESPMPVDKLSPEEISKAVAKIRQRYDEYIFKYFKPKTVKFSFEERYAEALQKRVDISTFLLAEISAVEELIRREEARIMAGPSAEQQRESLAERVERIFQQNLEKIRKYREINFHPTANEEIKRLVGALSSLEEDHWPPLAAILRDVSYSQGSLTMANLEAQLRYLGSLGADRVPGALSRYLYHLNRFPRDYPAIDREEKEYILESAFFLHDLKDILERVLVNNPGLSDEQRQGLRDVRQYVEAVIQDFRVKDLKRQK
jgi:hypothetical protein